MKPEDLTAGQKETRLSHEQIKAASGGAGGSSPTDLEFVCPACESTNVWYHDFGVYADCRCRDCGYQWYDLK